MTSSIVMQSQPSLNQTKWHPDHLARMEQLNKAVQPKKCIKYSKFDRILEMMRAYLADEEPRF